MGRRTNSPASVKVMVGLTSQFEKEWEKQAKMCGMDRNSYARSAVQQHMMKTRMLPWRPAMATKIPKKAPKQKEVSLYMTKEQAAYLESFGHHVPRWNRNVALGFILGEQLGYLRNLEAPPKPPGASD